MSTESLTVSPEAMIHAPVLFLQTIDALTTGFLSPLRSPCSRPGLECTHSRVCAGPRATAEDQGIVFGPGRGSASGSIISYALRITELDPLKYDLLFERFLNPDRISMPDIDIDIQDTRRDEVIEYCANKYGHDRVANIVTFGTMAARAAVRDV